MGPKVENERDEVDVEDLVPSAIESLLTTDGSRHYRCDGNGPAYVDQGFGYIDLGIDASTRSTWPK